MASHSKGEQQLRVSECTCPICLYILIKPVTLPCGHELCMPCFSQHITQTSLLCPLCRVRIAVWVRRATRQNSLINERRWKEIQESFPDKVKNRLEGKEDEEEIDADFEGDYYVHQMAAPGELLKEFEEQQRLLSRDGLNKQMVEEEASLKLIAEMMEEEAKKKEQERKDAELAMELSRQLNGPTPIIERTPSKKPKEEKKPSSSSKKSRNNQSPVQRSHLKMWYKPTPKKNPK